MHPGDAPPDPAQRSRQLDIQAQHIRRRFQARRLFGDGDDLFQFVQRTRPPCRQMIRQQTEGGMALRAVPARNPCSRRRRTHVGTVAGQRATTPRMVRAARETCLPPGFAANVFLAGEPRCESKLHRPRPGGRYRAGHSPFLPRVWSAETTGPALLGGSLRAHALSYPVAFSYSPEQSFNREEEGQKPLLPQRRRETPTSRNNRSDQRIHQWNKPSNSDWYLTHQSAKQHMPCAACNRRRISSSEYR